MSRHSMMGLALLVIMAAAAGLLSPAVARADDRAAEAALKTLYKNTPEAKTLEDSAKGILVFPNIKKAGFVVGAQYGTGTLFEGGRPAGHYRITTGSYGLQAGVQGFSYAMFFMTDDALKYLDNSAGFEIGVGPSVVVVDAVKAKTLTITTASRCLRLHLRPEGAHGEDGAAGLEDHEDQSLAVHSEQSLQADD